MQSSKREFTGNNNGSATCVGGEKETQNSPTPSPRMSGDDVKSEPMELVCGAGGGGAVGNVGNHNNSLAHEDHSNDSVTENEVTHSSSNAEIKGHLR